ncbi:MAG: bifunctional DNA-formamidopyrimidine glycosylase/DNA-(apurinic or apyrimidinic site) lyase [Actinomycetota bacterium]
MPELPEVETVRRGLESHVVGRVIESVEIGRERSVRRVGRETVAHLLTGARVLDARRRGKYLLCGLDTDGERAVMMVHLRMSGRLLLAPVGAPRPAHSHVVMGLSGAGEELRFVDPRTFGEVVVCEDSRTDEVIPELGRLGPDPIVDAFDADILASRLARRRIPIKGALLDQGVVAGIGNIYADEILHRARIKWNRTASQLSRQTVARLADTITEVLRAAIDAGGSTLEDTQYVDMEGETGSFQEFHRVYGRAGLPCLTCGKAVIRRAVLAGRSTAWCPVCQRR